MRIHTHTTADAGDAEDDLDLAPTTPLSTLPPRFNNPNSPSRPVLDAYTHPRPPRASSVRARVQPAAAAAAESSTADVRDAGEHDVGYGYGEVPVRGRVRVRAVPNSAFLRVNALHWLALVQFNSGENTEAASGTASAAAYPPTPRRPRECVVGLRVEGVGGAVVQISSLAAALAKLNIGIPVEDVIKAVHREDEAKRATLSAQATQRRAALSKLALYPTKQSTGLHMTTVSKFILKPTTPTNVDPLAKERRRRLVELTKDSFPDGKVPDPFTLSLVLGFK
ncbi:hypothetical protein C8F04DRAFT_1248089 [Mycena alexandri]|uniref:Uncharacterized protein n=1 Tax=Mycena alexandri TaxID=1745969 RepID=A0AAD6TKM4_9AGAR|nr:hypothetical protein C8F04DRAFT_1248089 [Mycena alexandri]